MRDLSRKNIALWSITIALGLSIISNIVIISNYPQPLHIKDPTILVIATASGPHTLEIVDVLDTDWRHVSNGVLEQVVETLFSHDLRDPDLPRINLLAESYYWKNKTTLQIKLREGVIFHDGTPFNASAVKWNLDRLQYLINATGTNTDEVAIIRSLWLRPDGKTPIINNTAMVGEYNITVSLNGVYGPFLNLLTYINAGMLSPTFHKANERNFIPLSGDICGTGPFTYDSYTPDVEVVLSRWEGYWSHVAYFRKLQFKIFDSASKAHAQMLSGQIDLNFMASYEDILVYEKSEHITVKHYTDDTGIPAITYTYLGINNKKYNETWRKIFSCIINYSHIIEALNQGNAYRANSIISPGFGMAYNSTLSSVASPDGGDLVVARKIIQSMGFGLELDVHNENAWRIQADTTPFETVRYTNKFGYLFNQDLDLFVAFTEWLKSIGCATEEIGDPPSFLDYFYGYGNISIDKLELFPDYIKPDYLDPYNIFQKALHPLSTSNSAQVNDTRLNNMMNLALNTTDDTLRDSIYKNIQGYIATQGYFIVPLFYPKLTFAHSADLHNFPYNALEKFQAYSIYRA